MDAESRKRLTEFIGEQFHHITDKCVVGVWKHWIDCDCGERFVDARKAADHVINRTFLTWADLGVVKEALERAGKWEAFCELTHDNTKASDGDFWSCNLDEEAEEHWARFYKWLIRPTVDGKPHFCQLCADFLKEV